MQAESWTEDGHVLVVEPGGMVRVECVGECRGPTIGCHECYGQGTIETEAGDGEVDCEACGGTGNDEGVRRCWMTADHFDAIEALDDPADADTPGRYVAVYQTWGPFDDFYVVLRRGRPAPPAGQAPSLFPPALREDGGDAS